MCIGMPIKINVLCEHLDRSILNTYNIVSDPVFLMQIIGVICRPLDMDLSDKMFAGSPSGKLGIMCLNTVMLMPYTKP